MTRFTRFTRRVMPVIAFSLVVLGYDTVWGPEGRPAWIRDARTYPFVNAASEEMVQLIEMRRELLRDDEAATSEEG